MAWIFILYLATLLVIGALSERMTKGMKGFLLGDRRTGPWATALSYEATAYSGWLMLGFPGRAFSRGLVAIWVGVACVLGDALNWITVARRLREQTSRLGALTIPEYLERRFARPGGAAVRMTASLAILIFMLIYLWSQFVASGKALATTFAMDYKLAALVSGAVMVIYTLQGGYRAVVWTDCVQGVMMFVALVLLPAACLYQLGGWYGLSTALAGASAEAAALPRLAATSGHLTEWFGGLSGLALLAFLSEDAGVGIGYLGQPHTCVRFMAIEDERQLRPAFLISIVWAAVVCAGAVAVGLAAHGLFRFTPGVPGAGDNRVYLADPEAVLPRLAMAILPEWLAGFVVSAILAAIMSSAASFLLSAASSLSRDVYLQFFRRGASEKEVLLVTRLLTGALGLVALGLAVTTNPFDSRSAVYVLVLYAWGGLAGCFSAPVVMALYYRGMTRAGCIAGMVVGAVVSLVWHNVPALAGVVYEVIPALLFSAVSILLVSRLTRTQEVST